MKNVPPIRKLIDQRDQLLREVAGLRLRVMQSEASSREHELSPEQARLQWWQHHPYYSPLPDLVDVSRRQEDIFVVPANVPGVELNEHDQLALIEKLAAYYPEQPFQSEAGGTLRYHFGNDWFNAPDALVLYGMLRHHRPDRVVEIGSGFSSAVMLDTNELFLDRQTQLTFIDPEPERLAGLLTDEDKQRCRIVPERLQDVSPELFDLNPGDFLFVDSSHVARVGSDVNQIFFEILPRLAPGVHVHFHDVFYPFEYPREWVFEGRAWNESYMLRNFLAFNSDFSIELFNSHLHQLHGKHLAELMPRWAEGGGSIWIERREATGDRGA